MKLARLIEIHEAWSFCETTFMADRRSILLTVTVKEEGTQIFFGGGQAISWILDTAMLVLFTVRVS